MSMDAIINEVELKKKQRESQKVAALKASGKKDAEIQAILAKKPANDVVLPKNQYDIQKMKLERLMKNPEKPVELPGPRKEWKPRDAPEFIRHVMGSSAGAGSGEFHVYRGIRRRENRRQAFLEKQYEKEQLDAQFKGRMEENKQKADESTAKKRAKRQKKKQKKSLAKRKKPSSTTGDDASTRSVSDESENDEDVKSDGDDVSDD